MIQELIHEAQAVAGAPGGLDRRRPGRRDVSPELVVLLRAPEAEPVAEDTLDWSTLQDEDAMAPARGLALGLLLAVPLWGVIGTVMYALID